MIQVADSSFRKASPLLGTIEVLHLYISPGHNFFGHHGLPPGGHPTLEVRRLRCLKGRGIEGDRFCDFKENYKGQITFFAWEVFEALRNELGLPGVEAGALRRNVITEGVALGRLIGEEFSVQGVSFVGVEECRPCYWMDRALDRGAETWMKGRGGLRARIVTSGFLRREAEALPHDHEGSRATAPR